MKLFFRSFLSGIAGGSLGGLVGMDLGLGHSPFSLSPSSFQEGLVGGAILGLFPAVVVALLHVARYRKAPRRSTRRLAPVHSAVLSFLSVSILVTIMVARSAAC